MKKCSKCGELAEFRKTSSWCKSCSNIWDAKRRKEPKVRAGILLNAAKRRCQKSLGVVTIDENWVLEKLKTGVCELTKLPFDFNPAKTGHHNAYSPSLDRIDSNNPNYSLENTRVVLASVNRALNEHGDKYLLPILKAMVIGIEQNG